MQKGASNNKNMNRSPKAQRQKVTELSELRRKFLAERDAEQEILLGFHNSTKSADYASSRIHQHSRKNLSSSVRKDCSIKLRRKPSKHCIKQHTTVQRRHSLSSFLQNQSDNCREENLSMHFTNQQSSEARMKDRTETSSKKMDRRDFRNTRAKSVVFLDGVKGTMTSTKPVGVRRQRRASVELGTRSKTQPKWLSNMSSKLGLDW